MTDRPSDDEPRDRFGMTDAERKAFVEGLRRRLVTDPEVIAKREAATAMTDHQEEPQP